MNFHNRTGVQRACSGIFLAALSSLPCIQTHSSLASSGGQLATEQFEVANLTLGLPEAEVRDKLEGPASETSGIDDMSNEPFVNLEYKDATAYFLAGALVDFTCRGSWCLTIDGVKVGDSAAVVYRTYGKASSTGKIHHSPEDSTVEKDYGGETFISYQDPTCDCYMTFIVRDGTIVSIRLWFDNM